MARGGETEYNKRISTDPGIDRTPGNGSMMTVDLAKVKSPEIKMALIEVLGLQSSALPEEIDRGFFDKLMEMDKDPEKMQTYLASLKPRISAEALAAAESRLKEAIAYAKELEKAGKVYGENEWMNQGNLNGMTGVPQKVEITKSDGNTIEAKETLKCVKDFRVVNCPSIYKREFYHDMFTKPA